MPTTITLSFTLPSGTVGSGSFTFPTDDIDASQSEQYIPINDLTIQLSDATLTSSNSVIQTTANFHNGSLLGVVGAWVPYGADIQTVDLEDSALQVNRNVPNPGTSEVAGVNFGPRSLIIDFNTATFGQAYKIDIGIMKQDGNGETGADAITINVAATSTRDDIRALVKAALTGLGYGVDESAGGRLVIKEKDASQVMTSVRFTLYTGTVGGVPIPDNTLRGPTYDGDVGGVKLWINGGVQN